MEETKQEVVNNMQVVEAIENNKQQEEIKKDFVERMTKEHNELNIKREKLDKFIKSPKFKTLDDENKFLLCAQLNSMANYQMILYRRIALNS